MSGRAFAPCHITGIFEIFDKSENLLHVGSRGAGASLSQGVETTVAASVASEDSLQVIINGSVSYCADVSDRVVEMFRSRFEKMKRSRVNVEHCVGVPIGAGFGTSGAAALSLALALNKTFELEMTKREAAQMAHIAEVECKTGLGTVIAEAFGGLEIRVKAGAPGIGRVEHVPIPDDAAIACLVFGPLSTKKCLTNERTRKRINELGGRLIDKLVEEPNVFNFLKLSRQFAEHVGLITNRIRSVLEATDGAGFVCSMPMFGESVFTIAERRSLEDLLRVFRKYGSDEKIIVSEIDREGARLL